MTQSSDFEQRVHRSIQASIAVKQQLLNSAEVVSGMAKVTEILIEALKKGASRSCLAMVGVRRTLNISPQSLLVASRSTGPLFRRWLCR